MLALSLTHASGDAGVDLALDEDREVLLGHVARAERHKLVGEDGERDAVAEEVAGKEHEGEVGVGRVLGRLGRGGVGEDLGRAAVAIAALAGAGAAARGGRGGRGRAGDEDFGEERGRERPGSVQVGVDELCRAGRARSGSRGRGRRVKEERSATDRSEG